MTAGVDGSEIKKKTVPHTPYFNMNVIKKTKFFPKQVDTHGGVN